MDADLGFPANSCSWNSFLPRIRGLGQLAEFGKPPSKYAILYSTLLYSTLLYSTLLYSTLLYYTILYYTILYYTTLLP